MYNPFDSFIDIINQFSNKFNYCQFIITMNDLILYEGGEGWRARIMDRSICECWNNAANENQLGDTSILAESIQSLFVEFVINIEKSMHNNIRKAHLHPLGFFKLIESCSSKFQNLNAISIGIILFSVKGVKLLLALKPSWQRCCVFPIFNSASCFAGSLPLLKKIQQKSHVICDLLALFSQW